MSIQVRCRCGNSWQAEDDLAGQQLLCSSCKEPVIVAAERSTKDQRESVSGLACPKCQSVEVAELPRNPISPDRGFICRKCGARLRGKTAIYLVAAGLALTLLVIATGVLRIFGDDRDERIVSFVRGFGGGWISSLFVIPLYLLVLGYSVRQLLRPKPLVARSH